MKNIFGFLVAFGLVAGVSSAQADILLDYTRIHEGKNGHYSHGYKERAKSGSEDTQGECRIGYFADEGVMLLRGQGCSETGETPSIAASFPTYWGYKAVSKSNNVTVFKASIPNPTAHGYAYLCPGKNFVYAVDVYLTLSPKKSTITHVAECTSLGDLGLGVRKVEHSCRY